MEWAIRRRQGTLRLMFMSFQYGRRHWLPSPRLRAQKCPRCAGAKNFRGTPGKMMWRTALSNSVELTPVFIAIFFRLQKRKVRRRDRAARKRLSSHRSAILGSPPSEVDPSRAPLIPWTTLVRDRKHWILTGRRLSTGPELARRTRTARLEEASRLTICSG